MQRRIIQDAKTWKRIDDFLAEAGAAPCEDAFLDMVRSRISDLVPTDLPPAFLRMKDDAGSYHCLMGWEEADTRMFNEKYSRKIMPVGLDYLCTHPVMDYRKFPRIELYLWLFRPKRIRWVLGCLESAYFSLFRTEGSPAFSDREICVYLTLSRHLANLASFHRKLAHIPSQAISRAELAHDCRPLSRREAEIVRLLALRMTAREISSVLNISSRTVECHIANAYEKLHVACRADLLSKVYGADKPFDTDT